MKPGTASLEYLRLIFNTMNGKVTHLVAKNTIADTHVAREKICRELALFSLF
jgi:hypothetical protein